jgi:hypothetical protein
MNEKANSIIVDKKILKIIAQKITRIEKTNHTQKTLNQSEIVERIKKIIEGEAK